MKNGILVADTVEVVTSLVPRVRVGAGPRPLLSTKRCCQRCWSARSTCRRLLPQRGVTVSILMNWGSLLVSGLPSFLCCLSPLWRSKECLEHVFLFFAGDHASLSEVNITGYGMYQSPLSIEILTLAEPRIEILFLTLRFWDTGVLIRCKGNGGTFSCCAANALLE